jgi:hypothetical protein
MYRNNKEINREAMKTRIFLTAMMIALTTCAIAGSNHFRGEDTLSTFNLAVISEQSGSEAMTAEATYTLPVEMLPSGSTSVNSNLLEEWMENRESWESENAGTDALTMEPANLEGWVESREAWEKQSTESESAPLVQQVNLEGWIAGLESWEQEDAGVVADSPVERVNLEGWVDSMTNWEQK